MSLRSRLDRFNAVLVLMAGCAVLSGANGLREPLPVQAAPAAPKARVVIVRDTRALDMLSPNFQIVHTMVERGICALADTNDLKAAWLTFVKTQDVIGIKVFSPPGPNSGTRPAVVAGVVRSLMKIGFPGNQIVIWDKNSEQLHYAGFYDLGRELGVRVEAVNESGYDPQKFYDRAFLGNLIWGDLEFGQKGEGVGRKSFLARLLSTNITRIINVTPLLNHNQVGVTGHLMSLAMGSVDNTVRFETHAGQLAEAVPEIYALEWLVDRVALNITDALICQYQGEQKSLLHYSSVLSQLRFGKDPVALDVLSVQEILEQKRLTGTPVNTNKTELFNNASLLELGVSSPKLIQADTINLNDSP